MKISIGLLLIMFFSSVCQAELTENFALIKDSDGYVNLRESDDLQSNIIKTLPNDTVVSAYCGEEVSSNKFCFIFTSDDQTGYI